MQQTFLMIIIINECYFIAVEYTKKQIAISKALSAPSIMQWSSSVGELKAALITGLCVIHGALIGVKKVTSEFSAELIYAR